MKKFKFELQRILTLKEKKEEMLRQELSRLQFKRQQHEHVKYHYEKNLQKEYEIMREKKSFVGEEREQLENFCVSIRNTIYNQEIMMKEYDIKIDKKRKEIIENKKEINTMEKLKERKLEQYNYDLMLDERKNMDEIANRLFYV